MGKYRFDHHGVDPLHHLEYQTPGFTVLALKGPKHPLGYIQHIFQLCIACQSLIQNKSTVFDLSSQL